MRVFFCFVLFFYPIFSFGMCKQTRINKIRKFFQQESDEYIIKKLQQVGDLNSEIESFTPLIWAIIFERVGIVDYLISTRKVDINQVSGFWKETPLHYAIFTGNKNIFKMLWDAGSITAQDSWGKTPADYLKAFPIK